MPFGCLPRLKRARFVFCSWRATRADLRHCNTPSAAQAARGQISSVERDSEEARLGAARVLAFSAVSADRERAIAALKELDGAGGLSA